MSTPPPSQQIRWPLERVLIALAGSMTLLSAALSAFVSPWFLVLTALVGVNQWLYVLVGACPASLVLTRAFHLRSVVYPERDGATRADRRGAGDVAPVGAGDSTNSSAPAFAGAGEGGGR